jgi:hypothetical protein
MDLCGPGQVPLAGTCEKLICRFHKAGDFLTSCVNIRFSEALVCGVSYWVETAPV